METTAAAVGSLAAAGPEGLLRRFAKDTVGLTAASFAGAILGLAQGVIVARWLGPQMYGSAALVIGLPTLVYALLDTRAGDVLIRYLSQYHARQEFGQALAACRLGYVLDVGGAGLAWLAVAAVAPWAAMAIMRTPGASGLATVYAMSFIPFAVAGCSQAVLSTFGRFPMIAVIETAMSLIRATLVISTTALGWEIAGIVWSNAVANALTGLTYGAVASALLRQNWFGARWRARGPLPKAQRREILRTIGYNCLNVTLGTIPKQFDLVVLGYVRGPVETGYYKLAKSLSGAFGYLVSPLQTVTYPMLASVTGPGQRPIDRQIRWLLLWVGFPLALAASLALAVVPALIIAIVGRSYIPAVRATQVLLIGSITWLAFFWVKPAYFALGRVAVWTGISVSIVALSLLGFAIAIPLGGFIALAVWQACMHVLGHLVAVGIFMRQRHAPGAQ
jgi:O-antigen/teichoic acid export membrane protein